MITKTFYLNNERTAYVKAYLLDKVLENEEKRPTIIIFPGGGYEFCSPREAEPLAMHFLARGYNAFVLYYSVNKKYPTALINAAYAIYKIKMRSDEFGINPDKIAVLGCSAGGHLAGSVATMWNDNVVLKTIGCKPDDVRPAAAVLCYPVISAVNSPHVGSFRVLLGDEPSQSDLSRLSLENRVTPKAPPMFIWCTADDDCVSAHNSLAMAKACVSNKVPCELHMFDTGWHGLSDCTKNTGCYEDFSSAGWVEMALKFLDKYLNI